MISLYTSIGFESIARMCNFAGSVMMMSLSAVPTSTDSNPPLLIHGSSYLRRSMTNPITHCLSCRNPFGFASDRPMTCCDGGITCEAAKLSTGVQPADA